MKTQATRIAPPQPATGASEKIGNFLTLMVSGLALASLYMIDWSAFQ